MYVSRVVVVVALEAGVDNRLGGTPGTNSGGTTVKTNKISIGELKDPLTTSYRHRIHRCRSLKRASSGSKVGATLVSLLLFLATSVSCTYENVDFENWSAV